jgi:hypothetical protein
VGDRGGPDRRPRRRLLLRKTRLTSFAFVGRFFQLSTELALRVRMADPALLPDDVRRAADDLIAYVEEHAEEVPEDAEAEAEEG